MPCHPAPSYDASRRRSSNANASTAKEGDISVENLASASPLSTAIGSSSNTTGVSPEERRWSASSSLEFAHPKELNIPSATPQPQERGTPNRFTKVWSIVSRQDRTGTSRYVNTESHVTESAVDLNSAQRIQNKIKELQERINNVLLENEALLNEQNQLKEELKFKDKTLQDLSQTNSHCRTLLSRNSKLEQLVCEIQTEADNKVSISHDRVRDAKRQVELATSRINELELELEESKEALAAMSSIKASHRRGSVEIANLNAEVGQQRITLLKLESEKKRAEEVAEFHQNETERLKRLLKGHVNALGDTAKEVANWVAANSDLEKSIAEMEAKHRKEIEVLSISLAEETNKGRSSALELEKSKADLRRKEAEIDILRKEMSTIEAKLTELEQLKQQQTTELERLRVLGEDQSITISHMTSETDRLRSQNKSFENIHKRCQELLSQNVTLRDQVVELKKQNSLLSISKTESSLSNKHTIESIKKLELALRESEAQINAKSDTIQELQDTIKSLRGKLADMEDKMLDVISPDRAADRTEIVKQAVENAIQIVSDQKQHEIEQLNLHYEHLLQNIRQSHASELSRLGEEYDQHSRDLLRQQLADLDRQHMRDVEEIEAEYNKSLDQINIEHGAQMKQYRDDLEASMTELQTQKEEEWKAVLKERDENHKRSYEKLEERLHEVTNKYREQLDVELEKLDKLRATLGHRDGEVAKLSTRVQHLEELLREMTNKSRSDLEKCRHEMEEVMERRLSNLRKDHESLLKQEKERLETAKSAMQNEMLRLQEDCQRKIQQAEALEANGSSLLNKSALLKKRFSEMVNTASGELIHQVESLKAELNIIRMEREKSEDDRQNILSQLFDLREELATSKTELNTCQNRLREVQTEYESFKREHCEDLKRFSSSLNGSIPDITGVSFLLKRNEDLEEFVSSISEQHHDEMRTAKRTSMDAASKIRELSRKLAERDNEQKISGSTSYIGENTYLTEQREMENIIMQLQKEKARIQGELDLEKVKNSSLETALDQNEQLKHRQQTMDTFINHLQDLESTLKQYMDQSDRTWTDTVRAIEDSATQKALASQVEFLEKHTEESRARIKSLELKLHEATSHPSNDNPVTDESIMESFRELRQERSKLKQDCHILEDKLNEQINRLKESIEAKNGQLQQLQLSNQKSSELLARNAELEEQILKLIRSANQISLGGNRDTLSLDLSEPTSVMSRIERQEQFMTERSIELCDLLVSFQQDFVSNTENLEGESRRLQESLEQRDEEINRLQHEIIALRNDLESAFAKKIESTRLRYETETNQLRRENNTLRNSAKQFEEHLLQLQAQMDNKQVESEEILSTMLVNLSNKIKYHQLMVAEIQDQRDSETARLTSMLDSSKTAQTALQEEIEKISKDLASKDGSIRDLSISLSSFLMEIENRLQIQSSSSLFITEESDNGTSETSILRLKSVFESLIEKLIVSQSEAQKLMENLRRLLSMQKDQLRKSERVRNKMETLVNECELAGNMDNILYSVETVQEDLLTNLQSSSPLSQRSISIQQDSSDLMEANQKLLDMLSEKEKQRDQEIIDLRTKLASIQVWDIQQSDLTPKCVEDYSKAQEAGLSSIRAGVEQLITSMEELNRLKDTVMVKRRTGANRDQLDSSESTAHSTVEVVSCSSIGSECLSDAGRSSATNANNKRPRIE